MQSETFDVSKPKRPLEKLSYPGIRVIHFESQKQ